MARLFDDTIPEYFKRTSAVVSTEPMTLSAWFNTDLATTGQTILSISLSTDASNPYFRINLAGDGTFAAQHNRNYFGGSSSTTTPNLNQWYHGCGVMASTTSVIAYLDGVAGTEDTTDVGTKTGAETTSIGYLIRSTPIQPFSGKLAELAIWDVALTANEVKMLAAGVSPLRVRPLSLKAYWPLPAFTGDAIDYSGNSNTLTDTNTVGVADHAPVAPMFGFDSYSGLYVPAGGGGSLSIPAAMQYYRQLRAR